MINVGKYIHKEYVIRIEANEIGIFKVFLCDEDFVENTNDEIECFKTQLCEYFDKKRKEFDVKIDLNQLPFRTSVYNHIRDINYGQRVFARDILEKMNMDKGISAITYAVLENPLLFIIPCHRIKCRVRRLPLHKYSTDFLNELVEIEKSII